MSENKEQKLQLLIRRQYVKDISFENPNVPFILDSQDKPEMSVDFNTVVIKLNEDKPEPGKPIPYEVVFAVKAQAKRGGKTAFLAEVEYGVEAVLVDVPEEQHHPMLYIEVPKHAFPFVRQILSDLVQTGGYPPLLLNPVDFTALYMENFAKDLSEGQQGGLTAEEGEKAEEISAA
jgi:preprotein translocase subunit SecB